MHRRGLLGTIPLLCLMGVACGHSGSSPTTNPAADANTLCMPNQSIACVGSGGCAGGQVCKSDGSGYQPCNCGSVVDAGSDGADAADAAGDEAAAADTGGDGADAAPCVAAPGTIYAQSAPPLGAPMVQSMCDFRGDVLLIVNVAALDGYTPQWAGLESLETTFVSRGFHVLGFFSDDFGQQGGTPSQIASADSMYGVTYPQFQKDHVVDVPPAPAQPVFKWLEAQPNPGPASSAMPTWNHDKYLVGRHGPLVAHWGPTTYPGKDPNDPNSTFDGDPIVIAIRAELAKP
jgi:glutathione peroxidase